MLYVRWHNIDVFGQFWAVFGHLGMEISPLEFVVEIYFFPCRVLE